MKKRDPTETETYEVSPAQLMAYLEHMFEMCELEPGDGGCMFTLNMKEWGPEEAMAHFEDAVDAAKWFKKKRP